MQTTPIGRAALESREGTRLTAYRDSVGVWTIGTGITTASGLITVTPGLTITQAQADALFVKALAKYETAVAKAIKVPLADHQADALVSICYNIGPGAFAGSTFVKRLNKGDVSGAAEAILMWLKPPEVTSRRQAEYDQFRTPYTKSLPKGRRSDAKPVVVTVVASPPPPIAAPTRPVLRRGDKGVYVRDLQTELGQAGHILRIDGDFGPSTEAVVRSFQARHSLTVDGVVGPKTWTALDAAVSTAKTADASALSLFTPSAPELAQPIRSTTMDITSIMQLVRYALIGVGSVVTARGWADDATVQWVIGGVITAVPAIWGFWARRPAAQQAAR